MTISSVASGSVSPVSNDGTWGLAQAVPATAQKTAAVNADTAAQAQSPERVAQAVKQVNDAFARNGQNLHAFIEKDKTTGIDVVKVQDKNTQEVISQFPPKAIIAMAEAINQYLEKKGQMMSVRA